MPQPVSGSGVAQLFGKRNQRARVSITVVAAAGVVAGDAATELLLLLLFLLLLPGISTCQFPPLCSEGEFLQEETEKQGLKPVFKFTNRLLGSDAS